MRFIRVNTDAGPTVINIATIICYKPHSPRSDKFTRVCLLGGEVVYVEMPFTDFDAAVHAAVTQPASFREL